MNRPSVKELALPALLAEGLLDPSYADLINTDALWVDSGGRLVAPEGFAKTMAKQRPHLFAVKSSREEALKTFVFPSSNANFQK